MRFLLFTLLAFTSCYAWGQLQSDTTFLADAAKAAIASYNKAIAGQSHLYNGFAYAEYQQQSNEHPYFMEDWMVGSIVYDDELFENVPLLVDIAKDRVITDHLFGTNKLQLVNEKIKSFTIGKHRFLQLNDTGISKGFYEITYDGNSKVFVRRQKNIQNKTSGTEIERFFIERTTYFIKKGAVYFGVKSKGSVINVFDDRKSEIKKFIKDNGLRFKSDRIKNINQVAAYYDQLTVSHES